MKKKKRATLQDIAKLAKVSPCVVSIALSDKQDSTTRLSTATKQRILRIAKELNYRPHAGARSIRLNRFNNIGVVVVGSYETDAWALPHNSGSLVEGINKTLAQRDYCLSKKMELG